MSNELSVRESGAVAHARQFTQDQVDLIKRTIARGVTDDELSLFMHQCARTGLDPFSRQIYAISRWSKQAGRNVMNIQVSIDGFRLIAERSGKYAGQIGPEWCGPDGVWRDVWINKEPPAAARVAVLRHDFAQPMYAVARYASYAQDSPLWQKMPELMLAKCAESLALRKAFPQDTSGLYSEEEMPIVSAPVPVDDPPPAPRRQPPPAPPKGNMRPWTSINEMLAKFAECRELLGDARYYEILGEFGKQHANEFIKSKSGEASACYTKMRAALEPVATDIEVVEEEAYLEDDVDAPTGGWQGART